jgi:hypothetical protein
MLGKLKHTNIVPRYGFLGRAMVLGYVKGRTLDALLRNSPDGLPPKMAAIVLRDVATALEHIHEQGIIHRDIKPSNIIIRDEDGRAVITDFGISKGVNERPEDQLTQQDVMVGTPQYAAPEQAAGNVTPATDIYQVGQLGVVLLTGRTPHKETDHTKIVAKLKNNADHDFHVREINKEVPLWLERIVEVCRAKDPNNRYTARELVARLSELIDKGEFAVEESAIPKFEGALKRAYDTAVIRLKEDAWEVHRLGTQVRYVGYETKLHKIKELLGARDYGAAQVKLDELVSETGGVPSRFDRLNKEFEEVKKQVASGIAYEQVTALVNSGNDHVRDGNFPALETVLKAIEPLLPRVPAEEYERLKAQHKAFQGEYEPHGIDVEILRIVEKRIQSVQAKLKEYENKAPAGADVLQAIHMLDEAQSKFDGIAPENLGRPTYDATSAILAQLRTQLTEAQARYHKD